jgi:hypothetical protein
MKGPAFVADAYPLDELDTLESTPGKGRDEPVRQGCGRTEQPPGPAGAPGQPGLRVAGGMLAEGVRQWSRGNRPSVGDLLLTPGNAQRVADQLSRLRGAAMKVGQLLSMDAGDLMPPELAAILARLRADAQAMPMSQLVPVLEAAWGRAGTGISSAFPSPAGRRVDWPGACGATEERRAPGDQGAVSRRAAEHCQRCG